MPTHEQWQKLASETSKWKARPRYWLLDFITHWSPIADTSSHHSLFLFRGLNDTSGTELERLTQNYFLEFVAMATRREPRQWLLWQLPGHPISVSWHYSSSGPLNQIFWAASLEGLCTDFFFFYFVDTWKSFVLWPDNGWSRSWGRGLLTAWIHAKMTRRQPRALGEALSWVEFCSFFTPGGKVNALSHTGAFQEVSERLLNILPLEAIMDDVNLSRETSPFKM